MSNIAECGILGGRVGHLVLGDLARAGIQVADRPVLVARVPDVALGIEGHRVRHCIGRQRIFLHLAGRWIDPPDQIPPLPGPPDGPVGGLDRIARPLAECRRHPFLERDLRGARYELGRTSGARGEMRCQVVRDGGLLRRGGGQIHHRADQLLPAVARVARARRNHVGLVARDADPLDHLLARPLRQPRTLGLGSSERDERESCGGDQGNGRRFWHLPSPNDLEGDTVYQMLRSGDTGSRTVAYEERGKCPEFRSSHDCAGPRLRTSESKDTCNLLI